MSGFDAASKIVLGIEGGVSWDARGGTTVYGHDAASWPDLLRRVPADVRAQLPASVSGLTRDTAILAYRAGYWDFCHCDDLPPSLALMLFDAAVNQGPGWAPRAFQTAVGTGADGVIGPATIQAAAQADALDSLCEFGWLRENRYRQASLWPSCGHGWIRRLIRVVSLSDCYTQPGVQLAYLPHDGTAAVA